MKTLRSGDVKRSTGSTAGYGNALVAPSKKGGSVRDDFHEKSSPKGGSTARLKSGDVKRAAGPAWKSKDGR